MTPVERDEVLEEAVRALLGPAADCAGLNPEWDAGRKAGAAAIRALKSPPREVLCEHGAGEGVECRECHPPIELASEENGLLPKSRRRKHEYGREEKGVRGYVSAPCIRLGCFATRLRHVRTEVVTYYQSDKDKGRLSPGPCLGK